MSDGDEELAKDLGPLAALTIGVGTMIGAGIFVLPGDAVSKAGSLAVGAFVAGGAIALLTALSASELGTAMPKSGGAYFYVNRALGPLFGSIAGWANWMGLAFASAFYMVGFGEYIVNIAGLSGGLTWGSVTLPVVGTVGLTMPFVKLIALAGAAAFVTVNYVGAKETGRLQNIIVVILVAILTVFTLVGATRADPANLPENKGLTAMMRTTGLIFVSYLGFVQITSVAEEIKDPDRNLPRAVIGSVVIVTSIYALVLIVMSMAVESGFIENVGENKIAVVEVGRLLLGAPGAIALLIGGLLATASSANASILASSRINFAMGRERIVTPALNRIHDRFGTPYRSIGITGGLILAFIVVAPINVLATVGSVLHLIIYGLLNLALIVMRVADPEDYDPSFTVPLYPVTPIVGAIVSFALIYFIDPIITVICLAFVLFAALWYLLYARTRVTQQGELGKYLQERDDVPGPAVSAAQAVQPDGGEYRVMVPLANPEHEKDLITLAAAMAKQRGGTVDAVHVVTVPDQTSLEYGADHVDQLDAEARDLLDQAREDAETLGVDVETHTILSHRGFEEVFDAARTHDADLTVMGWGPHSDDGRAEGMLDEITMDLPCDFLVLKDRGFDPSKVLVPTAGGPDSELSAAVAATLQSQYDAEVTLLHVLKDDETHEEAEQFLEAWASENVLPDAERVIDDSGDVEMAIESLAADHSMLVLGATERGLLMRMFGGGSPVLAVVDDVECSVLLAEKARKRSLKDRLFGR